MPSGNPTCACGVEVRPEWQFCPGCGRTTPKNCKRCNNALDVSWKVCPFCGEVLTAVAIPVAVAVPVSTEITPAVELTPIERPGVAPPPPDVTPQLAPVASGPAWEMRDLSWSLA